MMVADDVTGVVLAGGQSLRFGSNKALHKVGEETFLMRAISLLDPFCYEVLVSGDRTEYAEMNCPKVKDIYENCGPLGGIHAALKACNTRYALFLTCDMPLMTAAPLQKMLEQIPHPVVGWRPRNEVGGVFPMLLSIALLPEIEEALALGIYKIKRILSETPNSCLLDIPDAWMSFFANINRVEDLDCI